MEYKIFKVAYNDGAWRSGDLPHFYYVARSEKEVIAESKKYAEFVKRKESFGGQIWISEFNGIQSTYEWENIEKFNILMQAIPKQ